MTYDQIADLNVTLCQALGLDANRLLGLNLRLRPGQPPTITALVRVKDLVDGEMQHIVERYHLVPIDGAS